MEKEKKEEKCRCCICLDDVEDKNVVIFDCGHSMHLKCYIDCLINNVLLCPLCKTKINQNIPLFNHYNLQMISIIQKIKK